MCILGQLDNIVDHLDPRNEGKSGLLLLLEFALPVDKYRFQTPKYDKDGPASVLPSSHSRQSDSRATN